MGLDATVYLRGHCEDDDDCADYEAVDRRLGNIANVSYLHEQIAKRLPANSVLLEKVLYSSSHAGDRIELDLVPTIREELALLADDTDAGLRDFVLAMSELADAALEQGNPICF